ncbi:MAG: hypothetical protein KatS3mg015_0707 [Fimbriimonadales bacterium]|jgi:preprotein translocase SecE subunit|nr:MAG: hypothetical protein KatS3mg015_0707 [Fimbriimonadales bacterium]
MSKKIKKVAGGPGGASVPVPDMRGGIKGFIEGVIREMRRVVWPSWQETTRLTIMVLVVCIVFVVYLWLAGIIVDIALKAAEGQRINLG